METLMSRINDLYDWEDVRYFDMITKLSDDPNRTMKYEEYLLRLLRLSTIPVEEQALVFHQILERRCKFYELEFPCPDSQYLILASR